MENDVRDIFLKTRKIYDCLGDELSKELFTDKLMYVITSDKKFLFSLLDKSFDCFAENIKKIDNKDETIIYGAGINITMTVYACQKYGINVSYICDKDINKQGKTYADITVISPDELISNHRNASVIVSTTSYYEEVIEYLKCYFQNEQIIPFANSKQIDLIRNQYFDEVMNFEDGEVFVDGGSFDFDTSKKLMNLCNVKKIYAFEPDVSNIEKVRTQINEMNLTNVEIISAGLWNCNTTLHFSSQGSIMSKIDDNGDSDISVVEIDEIIDDRVTFIKMDIEGSELKALQGAEKIIRKYKPKLAISIYHRLEDIIEIPNYIYQLVPEYKLYIRHYAFNESETVLYATI